MNNNERECSRCKVPKGFINMNKGKPIKPLYVDEKGGRWKHRICASCVKEDVDKKLNKLGPNLPSQMTTRLCRSCNLPLPAEFYYKHRECSLHNPELSEQFEDLVYA